MSDTKIQPLTPELVARMDEISSDREAYRIQPGWWVAGRTEDDVREWSRVRAVLEFVHRVTNHKVIQIHSESPVEPGVIIEMNAHHGQFVLCLNKAEVKRLGLADAR